MTATDTPTDAGAVVETVRRGTTLVPGMRPGAPRRNVVVALTYLLTALVVGGAGLGALG